MHWKIEAFRTMVWKNRAPWPDVPRWVGVVLLLFSLSPGAFAVTPAHTRGNAGTDPGEVLSLLQREFVDPDRFDPLPLLRGALVRASEAIPSLRYRFLPAEEPRRLAVTAGGREAVLRIPPGRGAAPLRSLLAELTAFLASALEADPPHRLPGDLMLEGLLQRLDPYSALLSSQSYNLLQKRRAGKAKGWGEVGLRLGIPYGLLTISSVLPGSPAEKAGVHPGDRILQIDQHPALRLQVEEAEHLIRGRPGALVTLRIMRAGAPAPSRFPLRRNLRPSANVSGHIFPSGNGTRIGYVKVRSFQQNTEPDIRAFLQKLRLNRPGVLGLVLDLRGNPGGTLEDALQIADLFLARGTIATLRGPGIASKVIRARWYRGGTGLPLVVLIDRGTASAAEIVAGALRSNRRALLIGQRSFGKNSIQSVFPLTGGNALKLTVATFRTGSASPASPDFSADSEAGVLPHVTLIPVRPGKAAGTMEGVLASGLAGAAYGGGLAGGSTFRLPYDHDAGAGGTGRKVSPRRNTRSPPKWPHGDYALELARRLLSDNPSGDPAALLRHAGLILNREMDRQAVRWERRLLAAGIDWSQGTAARTGRVELIRVEMKVRAGAGRSWRPPDGGGKPGEEMRLTLALRNTGPVPLHRVLAVTRSAAGFLRDLELPVGLLASGEARSIRIRVRLPSSLPGGLEKVAVQIYSQPYSGKARLHEEVDVFLPFRSPPKSRLRVEITYFEDGTGGSKGNGDGRLQPGETLALRIRLVNKGFEPSGQGGYWVGPLLGNRVQVPRPLQTFASIPPGKSTTGDLLLAVGPNPASLPLRLTWSLGGISPALPALRWPIRLAAHVPLRSKTLQSPEILMRPPEEADRAEGITLQGRVRDRGGVRDLQVFLNGRKVFYRKTGGTEARELPFSVLLPATPGRNLVRLIARNQDRLEDSRSVLVWRGRGKSLALTGSKANGFFPRSPRSAK